MKYSRLLRFTDNLVKKDFQVLENSMQLLIHFKSILITIFWQIVYQILVAYEQIVEFQLQCNTHREVIWQKTIFEFDAQGQKCQNGYLGKKQPLCLFWHFFPVHRFQNFFLPNDFSLIIMKDLLHNIPQKVYLALSRPVHVFIWEDELNYFKFSSLDFKNSF